MSLHWLTLPVLGLALTVYGWFAAALGLWISIQLRSTWRAEFLTIASLLLVNVAGQGIINMMSIRGYAPQLWPGFTPYEVGKLVLNAQILERLSRATWPQLWRFWDLDDGLGWLTIFSVISLMSYAVLAAFLTWEALRRFDRRRPAQSAARVFRACDVRGSDYSEGGGAGRRRRTGVTLGAGRHALALRELRWT